MFWSQAGSGLRCGRAHGCRVCRGGRFGCLHACIGKPAYAVGRSHPQLSFGAGEEGLAVGSICDSSVCAHATARKHSSVRVVMMCPSRYLARTAEVEDDQNA